jgi:pSer/pThr/pTyr-binding forkhead associated (FHA) protein
MWILRTKIEEEQDGSVTFRLMPGAVKTLGRATGADFILDATLVSRLHCRFTATPNGELEIEDLRSTNGTFVNDRRVKRGTLAAGDRVRVGRVELLVTRDHDAAGTVGTSAQRS